MDAQRLREVIASAQSGQAWAYQSLLEAYAQRLYGYFLRACGNHHDAEDLLSETSLRLVGRLKTYDDRGRFEPWLFRIAANLVRDRIRRRKANPVHVSLSAHEDGRAPVESRLPGNAAAVDSRLLAAEDSVKLAAAIDRLDETTRQMILLRHFGEMSFKEIAEICGCPLGTVLARVHRGYKALRQWMGGEDGTE
jgi:RNA polymerase sigma-70 factor (ECF subfamily)